MAIKTFNIDSKTYKEFSSYCKKEGISMSKRIENFIKSELETIKTNSPNKKFNNQVRENKEKHVSKTDDKVKKIEITEEKLVNYIN